MRLQLPLHLTLSAAVSMALLGSAPQAAASVPTTTTLAVTAGGSAVTTVTSGTVVTLTATVLAGTTPVTPGQVNFCNAAASNCIGLHLIATAQLTSAGTATYKFRPGPGSHSYSAVFVGTPNGATAYASSTSSAAALSVTGLWPSITTLASSPGTTSGTYNLTTTVGGNGSAAPTGSLSILDASNGNAILGTATLGAGTAGVSFLNSSSNPTVGTYTGSVAVGDFNGDGIPDLVVPNYYNDGNIITVYLGNGDGTFTAAAQGPIVENTAPYVVAVGDFNGDGNLDVAVANYQGTVTVLLGDGMGNFTPAATSPAIDELPVSIAVGDFNGDGILDLAVASLCGDPNCQTLSGSVTILLGDGTGNFTEAAESPITLGNLPGGIVAGDFNGDGNLDLAVVNEYSNDLAVANKFSNSVSILLGNGNGTFTAASSIPVGGYPTGIAADDFNGDGILDLAVTNQCASSSDCDTVGRVTILLGNGDGTFTATTASPQTGQTPLSVAAGDFNGDGVPDLAVANESGCGGGTATILLGNGDGTFTPTATSPAAGFCPYFVALGDFNGDGLPDLVVANNGDVVTTGSATVLLDASQSATATLTAVPVQQAHQVVASYAGDSNYDASTSVAIVPDEAQITPTVTVTPSSSSITATQVLTVTVAVSGPSGFPAPTGWVSLAISGHLVPYDSYEGQNILLSGGSAPFVISAGSMPTIGNVIPLSGGSAQFSIPGGSEAPGANTLIVSYTPDTSGSAVYASAVGTGMVFVTLVTPTVTVTPLATSILITQPLQVSISVSGPIGPSGENVPFGSVTLTCGSFSSSPATLSAAGLSGTASITIPAGALSLGTDTLTANYTPGSPFSVPYSGATGSSSVTVNTVTPTVLVSPASKSILISQAISVVVAVSGQSGGSAPTGNVTLTSGSYNSGAVTLSSGSATINIPANSLGLGTDTLTAVYTPDSGSPDYSSASGSSTVVVSSFTPTVTVTPLATSVLTTQALQVNVSVSGPSGDPTPTGSVDLTSGSYDSGAVTLSGGSTAISVPAGSLNPGSDTLTASYTPDSASIATYSSATGSNSVTVIVPNGSPVVGSISPAVETAGNSAFTLTVNGSGFVSASTVYWGTSALTTTFVSAAQITAQVPAADIANSGTDSITVESPSPGGGTSNALQFEVDSSGAGSPSFGANTATVSPGQSATYSVTLPSAATTVTASCLNLPTGASCSFSSTANTLTIATASSTPAGTYQVTLVFTETVAGAASAFIFLPILMLPLVRLRRKWTAGKIWFTACLGLVLLVASAGIGCGGGGSSGTPPPPATHQVTTSGVVTLTVQ